MIYAEPGSAGATVAYKAHYDNFIGGKWVPPVKGTYFDVITPISGKVYTKAARSTSEDIELALDAAHEARAVELVAQQRAVGAQQDRVRRAGDARGGRQLVDQREH